MLSLTVKFCETELLFEVLSDELLVVVVVVVVDVITGTIVGLSNSFFCTGPLVADILAASTFPVGVFVVAGFGVFVSSILDDLFICNPVTPARIKNARAITISGDAKYFLYKFLKRFKFARTIKKLLAPEKSFIFCLLKNSCSGFLCKHSFLALTVAAQPPTFTVIAYVY
jgi:hypothetical protein